MFRRLVPHIDKSLEMRGRPELLDVLHKVQSARPFTAAPDLAMSTMLGDLPPRAFIC